MFERPGGGEKAVLVQLDFGQGDVPERLEELKLLARCDRQGRQRGVEAPTVDEAIAYLRELARMCEG